LYRPYHYVGLELNVSIANAVLRGIPTGSPIGFFGDVVATAKKDLKAGEFLDGEGGYTVWGQLVSANHSVATGALPVALAHHVELRSDVAKGGIVRWDDVIMDDSLAQALEVRRETEALALQAVPAP
ncbi:MAG: flagellar biosynthesis protein FlgA, partial [Arthrobacter sp.]